MRERRRCMMEDPKQINWLRRLVWKILLGDSACKHRHTLTTCGGTLASTRRCTSKAELQGPHVEPAQVATVSKPRFTPLARQRRPLRGQVRCQKHRHVWQTLTFSAGWMLSWHPC